MHHILTSDTRGSRSRYRLLALVATIALSVVSLGAQRADASAVSVPFTASVAGTVTPTGPLTFDLAGTGRASQLGNVQQYRGTVEITGFDPDTGTITDVLVETLVSANGDTLTILCQQVASPTGPGSPVYIGSDTWTVIGGTGRFAGATGSGTGTTTVDLGSGTFTKQMTGQINY